MNIQEKKIENIILYFANQSKNNTIDRLKLMKLIWLSDRLHLNKYGRLILKDRYKALPNGPIASLALRMSNFTLPEAYNVKGYKIKSLKDFDSDFFSKSDLKIMNYVWGKFGALKSFKLRDYSHLFPEWLRFEEELESNFTPNSYDIVIQDFFKNPNIEEFSDILSVEDSKLSEKDFNIHNSIQSLLKA
jgi:uncharacterized phage-associated protein